MSISEEQNIVLFDGDCGFCNASVQWIVKRSQDGQFDYHPLQSLTGKILLKKYGFSTNKNDSLVFIAKGQVFEKSTAALNIASHLGGIYTFFKVFLYIPESWRDMIYFWVARNRMLFMNDKKDSCKIV